MKISVFTPSHNTAYLIDAWHSIKNQEFHEWVIALNGGTELPIDFPVDPRIKVVTVPTRWHEIDSVLVDTTHWIGYLKHWACSQCTGDVFLELDHDDLLMPTAIADVNEAFEANPDVGFVYSNTVHCDMGFQKIRRFDTRYGWQYREVAYQDPATDTVHILDEHVHFEPTPNCLSRIWFAPNHLRAWRATTYWAVGGHNTEMRVLDDLDLIARTQTRYLVDRETPTRFLHIDKGLYIYRLGTNTFAIPEINDEIQANVYRIHNQYIHDLVDSWCDRGGVTDGPKLLKLELGGRMYARPGYTTLDIQGDVDITWDLNMFPWPIADNSVGSLRAMDVLEHLDPKKVLNVWSEIYRVLAPGGYAFIQVPSTDGRGAFSDPTHSAGTFYNELSFEYYTNREYQQYLPTWFKARFQGMRVITTVPDARGVSWVQAQLVKLVDDLRVPGEVLI